VLQGVNPWIEVDGGVTPENAYKVRRPVWGSCGCSELSRVQLQVGPPLLLTKHYIVLHVDLWGWNVCCR
jgi:hypothetical protein